MSLKIGHLVHLSRLGIYHIIQKLCLLAWVIVKLILYAMLLEFKLTISYAVICFKTAFNSFDGILVLWRMNSA